MVGLLDLAFPGSDGGGLLDFLKRNAAASIANSPGGMQSDTAQYGGAPAPAMPSAPPVPANPPPVIMSSAAPAAAPMSIAPAATAAALQPGAGNPAANFFNRTADALASVARGGSMLGAIRGQFDDPASKLAQTNNLTVQALVGKGMAPQMAMAIVGSGNPELIKQAIDQAFNQGQYTQETDKDGNVWNVNKQTGQKTVALQAKDDKFTNVVVKNPDGSESIRSFNTKTGEYGPPSGPAPGASGEILGDASKTGADYIASLPADKRDTVKGMIDGTIQPPTSFAAAKPYWQQMITAAKHADPLWDENTWAARHKMAVDLASSGNSSMGGILSNGQSAFKHLAEYTKSVADQGNVSHNFWGGGMLAHAQNSVGNAMGGSDTQAKVKAVNDNLGHYGQESTKFYAGTGGGVEERMNALHEMNANSTSGEEAAAYAEKEKGLMLDRLNEKLKQIRDVYGEAKGNAIIAQKMPDIQRSVDAINANIDRLRGVKPGSPKSASFGTPLDVPRNDASKVGGTTPTGIKWSVE